MQFIFCCIFCFNASSKAVSGERCAAVTHFAGPQIGGGFVRLCVSTRRFRSLVMSISRPVCGHIVAASSERASIGAKKVKV